MQLDASKQGKRKNQRHNCYIAKTDKIVVNKSLLQLSPDMQLYDPKARELFNELPFEKRVKSLNAKTFILYPFELKYNQDKPFEVKETETMFLIEEHLKKYKKPFIASSYGMDSVCMMHLVQRAAKNIGVEMPQVWLNNTLNIYKDEPKYWKEINELFGIKDKFKMFTPPKDKNNKPYTVWSIAKKWKHLPHFRGIAAGNDLKSNGNSGKTPKCCDILKKKSIKNYLKSMPAGEKYDLNFVGTRAEESRMRAMSVLQRCRSYDTKTVFGFKIRTLTPIMFWRKEDVSKYYAKYDIPKNPTYKIHNITRMGCASCPAYRYWEVDMLNDPTDERYKMLKLNLKILSETQPERYQQSLDTIKKYVTDTCMFGDRAGAAKREKIKNLDPKLDEYVNSLAPFQVSLDPHI